MGQPLTSLRQHFAPTAAADMDPSKLPLEMQAVASALKAAGPRPGEDAQTRTVLDAIELEQSRTAEVGLGYAHALQEVQAGGKASHWVWYVWPSMDGVRTTSRPQFSLPSVQAHVCYINRKVSVQAAECFPSPSPSPPPSPPLAGATFILRPSACSSTLIVGLTY